jgi:Spy/CpxP family protein refolding chaperone
MKPHSMVLALAFCVSLVSIPGAQPLPEGRGEKLAAIVKQLNLTPEQEKQLIPILRAEGPKLQTIKNDPSLSRAEKLQRLRAVHEESNPQVRAILTPAQYQQLQVIRRQRIAELMQAAKNN